MQLFHDSNFHRETFKIKKKSKKEKKCAMALSSDKKNPCAIGTVLVKGIVNLFSCNR